MKPQSIETSKSRMPLGKIPRVCLLSAAIVSCSMLLARGSAYWEGQSFHKSWILLPLALVAGGAFLAFLVTAVVTLLAGTRWQVVSAILFFPVAWVGVARSSLPDFTDGMRAGLQRKIKPERLLRFAEIASAEPGKSSPYSAVRLLELMKRDFPEIYALSPMEPRVASSADYVQIFWGSALVEHWGIQIGARPFSQADEAYRQGVSYREAFDGIWVYHDRY